MRALPILAATLMTDEPVILHNVPNIRDVNDMRKLVASLGVKDRRPGRWFLADCGAHGRPADLDPDLCRRIRASILLAGPMLARTGDFPPSPAGRGCDRPPPPGYAQPGAQGPRRGSEICPLILCLQGETLKGANILLDEASVTATENVLMAAVTASGTTVIRNSASEPHIQDLCQMLNALGANITGIGSNTLHIEGVERCTGASSRLGRITWKWSVSSAQRWSRTANCASAMPATSTWI
jgi:UDP-N-acetylglucosamine 1-carboxyvinyltransferase